MTFKMDQGITCPVRVLQVIGSMNLGGAEAMIMNLYRKMDREKVQFDFLLQTYDESIYEKEIKNLGGRIFRINKFRGKDPKRYYKDCCKFFEEHPEIRVVHGHIGSSAALYLKAAKQYGCFTIAHSHSALKIRNPHDFLFYVWSYPTRYIADQMFGCSTEAGIARYGKRVVSSEKYQNFNNGIDIDQFDFSEDRRRKIREEFKLKEELIIGTVGRLTLPKNPQKIFEIFKKTVQLDSNARCLWVGTGELEGKYHDLIRAEGLENRIIMTGPRTDVSDVLQAFDAFLFPSLWEGLPVSVIEAQATGLPCILSDTISREVDVSHLVEWMSIEESNEAWADMCLEKARIAKTKGRTCPRQAIGDAGYDITKTSHWLQKFYIEKASRG